MAVIINEFEVVLMEPAPPEGQAPAQTPNEKPAMALAPADIMDILCHEAERAARVRAH